MNTYDVNTTALLEEAQWYNMSQSIKGGELQFFEKVFALRINPFWIYCSVWDRDQSAPRPLGTENEGPSLKSSFKNVNLNYTQHYIHTYNIIKAPPRLSPPFISVWWRAFCYPPSALLLTWRGWIGSKMFYSDTWSSLIFRLKASLK